MKDPTTPFLKLHFKTLCVHAGVVVPTHSYYSSSPETWTDALEAQGAVNLDQLLPRPSGSSPT